MASHRSQKFEDGLAFAGALNKQRESNRKFQQDAREFQQQQQVKQAVLKVSQDNLALKQQNAQLIQPFLIQGLRQAGLQVPQSIQQLPQGPQGQQGQQGSRPQFLQPQELARRRQALGLGPVQPQQGQPQRGALAPLNQGQQGSSQVPSNRPFTVQAQPVGQRGAQQQGQQQGQQTGFPPALGKLSGGQPTIDFDTPQEIATRGVQQQNIFLNLPEVKDFKIIRAQTLVMDDLVKASKAGDFQSNIALDQALITTFNKITDPGSVVRVSEFLRTQQSVSFVNKLALLVNKFKAGGIGLTKENMDDLVLGAKIIADARGKVFNEVLDRFDNQSRDLRINPRIATANEKRHKLFFESKGKDSKKSKLPANIQALKDQGLIVEEI